MKATSSGPTSRPSLASDVRLEASMSGTIYMARVEGRKERRGLAALLCENHMVILRQCDFCCGLVASYWSRGVCTALLTSQDPTLMTTMSVPLESLRAGLAIPTFDACDSVHKNVGRSRVDSISQLRTWCLSTILHDACKVPHTSPTCVSSHSQGYLPSSVSWVSCWGVQC